MLQKRRLFILFLSLITLVVVNCREEEATPTPSLPTATPTPRPTATAAIKLLSPILEREEPLQPEIVGQNPAPGAEVALDGFFEVYFDQPMDETATAAALQVVDNSGNAVTGEIAWPRPRVLRFKPARPLQADTTYRATLAETAVSAAGHPLLEGLTLTFETIGDLVAGQVAPAPSATDVAIDSTITVIFNRPIVPLLVAGAQENLPNPLQISPETPGQGEWVNTSVYVFRPDAPLIGRAKYSVGVSADVINDISATGATMAEDFEWSFTVAAPTVNVLNLVNRTSSPRDNYEDLRLGQTYQVLFNQPMDPESTEAAVSLQPDDGAAAPLEFAWNDDFTTVTITPTQLLALGTRYTLSVGDSALSAHGGQLREGLTWHATTVQPPAIVETVPAAGSTQGAFSSVFRIKFASPMDAESILERVIITPEIEGDPEGEYDPWGWSQNYYGLQPSTTYTVQILPGMADPYGNEITSGQTFSFTTAAADPYAMFNFPGRLALYRQEGSNAAWVSYRNVTELNVGLYRLSLEEFGRLLNGTTNPFNFLPGEAARVQSWNRTVSAALDATAYERFDLVRGNGDPLEPGLYFLTLDTPQIQYDNRHLRAQPLVVATANLALKTTATEAMMWLTDLASGDPVAGVPVAFYDQNFDLVFSGETGADGLLYRDDLALDVEWDQQYYAITDAADAAGVFALATSDWNGGVYPGDFGITANYYLQPNQPTVYVYTDRPIYRPGQPVSIKGIVRLNDDLNYSLPDYGQVRVTISSYEETIYEKELPLSEYGSFTAQLTLDEEAALGTYFIRVQHRQSHIGGGYFDVAEYRKPTFQVGVNAGRTDVAAGDIIALTAEAQFFAGGAVVGGEVAWAVRSSAYTFDPGGDFSRYSFRDDERDRGYFYYSSYEPSETIAEGSGQLDENGRFAFEVPAELSEGDGSRRFTIEATVTDIVGNIVSDRTTVVVHRGRVYPGIKSERYVGQVDEEMDFDLVTVDWEGEPVAGQAVSVEIVERRWYSVQEENERGETIWETTVEEIPVTKFENMVTGENGEAAVTFVPPNGGVFRAIVTTRDEQGNEARASTYVWVSGSDYVSWRRSNDRTFDLVADAENYRPGDTAELLIASPFQGRAWALVTVERGHIKQYDVIELANNSTIYRLPITGEMAPNAFVSVMVMKGVDETNPAPDFRVGMVEFTVERDEQELQVQIEPDKTTVGPGDTVNYTVRVRDFQNQAVDAEVSLALVDLAALSITRPNSQPILDHFYSRRWLSVNTALLLIYGMDSFNQELEEQFKGGGGGGEDLGVTTIREEFPDTAYWEGQVSTGPDGEATVSITLPDNLTTWRMDARAVTAGTKVGQATVDIVATRPLLVMPQTPRFFVVRDTAQVGTAVHNNTGQSLQTTVTLDAEGVIVSGDLTQEVTVAAQQQAFVSWEVIVADTERVDLVFSARSGDYADASRPVLGTLEGQGIPVYRYQVPETVGTSGQITEGGAVVESIGLPIFPDFELTEGEVTVEVAPSLAAAMTDGLAYLEHYPYECTEQIVSRFLPNVLTVRALQAAELSNPTLEANLEEQVNVALQRLYSRQRSDGGWPWWNEPRSNTLVTAYVVWGLVEAQESGFQVSEGVIDQGLTYLRDHLPEVESLDGRYKYNRQAFLVYVLARAADAPAKVANDLYENRQRLDLYAQGFLAQALYLSDEQDPRLETLASDFTSAAILSASGANWEEAQRDFWNWNTDTRTTAIVLDTMTKLDPGNPLVANAVRWLMAHRTDGRWQGTQETAWVLMALTDWMVVSGELEANYEYEVALNGELLGSGEANAATLRDTMQLRVDITRLLTDELNRLAIGRSEGPGNLYYTAHLQASLPVEEVRPLERGIIISRSYFDPNDRQTPISEMAQGETFLARLTIVVPNTLHYVLVEDFLPAGLEAIDQSLKTSQQIGVPRRFDWDSYFENGWGWWYFDHVELRDEKVVLSANLLPAGTYEYVYLVRATTPGEYRVIPPTAQEFYFPEVYGRGAGSLFQVLPKEE